MAGRLYKQIFNMPGYNYMPSQCKKVTTTVTKLITGSVTDVKQIIFRTKSIAVTIGFLSTTSTPTTLITKSSGHKIAASTAYTDSYVGTGRYAYATAVASIIINYIKF